MDIVTIPNNKPTCKWQNHHYRVRQIKHENARFLSAFCAYTVCGRRIRRIRNVPTWGMDVKMTEARTEMEKVAVRNVKLMTEDEDEDRQD